MNNPQKILRTLDAQLKHPTRIVLFGRAALALGYDPPEPKFAVTNDVDAILPSVEMATIEKDHQFWDAIEATNDALGSSGLYITHLFTDEQVVITPGWLSRIVPIASGDYRHLRLFRPAGIDLLLTKMMRIDPQELEDLRFILERERITKEQVTTAAVEARVPPIAEIREVFQEMIPVVEAMAAAVNP